MIADAEQWGEGSHADRLERIIARAKQADRLEAQLVRECEKRQKAEFDLKRVEDALRTTEFKPMVEEFFGLPDSEYEPLREAEIIVIAKPEITGNGEDDVTGFDWRTVPNAELNGDRRHDAYHEKLRRSVEAIQEYNAGLDDSDQFAITGSLLRQLSKVKPGLVKDWMSEHKPEIEAYNAGFGARQNTGKPNPRKAIKWSEVAYGEYEW